MTDNYIFRVLDENNPSPQNYHLCEVCKKHYALDGEQCCEKCKFLLKLIHYELGDT